LKFSKAIRTSLKERGGAKEGGKYPLCFSPQSGFN